MLVRPFSHYVAFELARKFCLVTVRCNRVTSRLLLRDATRVACSHRAACSVASPACVASREGVGGVCERLVAGFYVFVLGVNQIYDQLPVRSKSKPQIKSRFVWFFFYPL